MKFLFDWWHTHARGRALLEENKKLRNSGLARQLLDSTIDDMQGVYVCHTFNDYHRSARRPVGTWEVIIRRTSPPPDGRVVQMTKR